MDERPDQPDVQTPVLVLVRDLLMGSKVTGAARRQGVEVRLLRDPSALEPQMPGRLALGDLDMEGAIEALASWGRTSGQPVAGFVQHVNVEVIRRARAAGIETIIPRSRLEGMLPGLLGGL